MVGISKRHWERLSRYIKTVNVLGRFFYLCNICTLQDLRMATINVFISVHVDSLIHRYNVERAQSKKNVICTPKLF